MLMRMRNETLLFIYKVCAFYDYASPDSFQMKPLPSQRGQTCPSLSWISSPVLGWYEGGEI